MFRKLQWKLFALVAVIVIVASVLSAGVASVLIRRETESLLAGDLKDKGILFRRLLSSSSNTDIDALCKEVGKELGVRFTVVAQSGLVLGDSHADPAAMVNHRNRPEIISALKSGYGKHSRLSETENVDNLYVAVRLHDADPAAGIVRTAVPLYEVREATYRAYKIIGLAALVALAAALALGLWGSRRFTNPITQMIAFASRMAEGDFAATLSVRTKDEVGSLGDALGSMRDQLREKVEALEGERQRLEAILGGMNEGVVATDASRRVVFANAALARFLDIDTPDIAGRDLHEVCRSPELNELVDRSLQSGEPHTREISLPGGNGISVHLYVAPIPTSRSQQSGVICVLHDITDLRNLERMRIEFVANASHELKTPLSAIIGSLETLTSGATDDPEACSKFVAIAEKHSRRLHALVRDLLDLSRIESTEFAPVLTEVNLSKLLERVRAAFADRVEGKKQTIALHVEEGLESVCADETLLDQALYNLIDNSVKYTPEGGEVTVAVEKQSSDVVFSVSDTGIGIPRKDLPRLFERFYRVDKARSRELGGTGLGLSIVKHVALAHGGRVEADSGPGGGTTIRIFLPIDSPKS